jgi:hypothetical protein
LDISVSEDLAASIFRVKSLKSSETLVSYHNTAWHHNLEDNWSSSLHKLKSQNIETNVWFPHSARKLEMYTKCTYFIPVTFLNKDPVK